MTTMHESRWFLPLFSVALGIACFVAFWIGDEEGSAWFALGLMSAVGAAVLVGGRFDMVRGLPATAETSTGHVSTSMRPRSPATS